MHLHVLFVHPFIEMYFKPHYFFMAFVSNAYHSDLKHDLRNRNPVGASYFIPIEINKYAWQTHNPKYVLYSFNALKILNILLLKKPPRPNSCP